MGKKIRVLIVDDHALVREGLRKILSIEPAIEVTGEAVDGRQAIEYALKLLPDIILMDINLPVLNGLEATRAIKKERPEIGIIALTIHDQREYFIDLIRSGISGYMLKDIAPSSLIQAIFTVARGESFIPPSMLNRVFAELNRLASRSINESPPNGLTKRELDVLKLLASGVSNRGIAKMLFISEKTVKNHLTSIFQKLGVVDRTQAALHAVKNKIVNL